MHRHSSPRTGRARTPGRALAAAAVTFSLVATACGSSATVDSAATTGSTTSESTGSAPTSAPIDVAPTTGATETVEAEAASPAPAAEPDPAIPAELVVSLPGPGVAAADGLVSHSSVRCDDDLDLRQPWIDFAVPAGWETDIGNRSGTEFETTYAASLGTDTNVGVDIRNQQFLLIQIGGFVNHGLDTFGRPIETPELPRRTPWFGEDDLNPLTVVGEASVGGTALPVYHSQTQGIEDQYGQTGGDIAVWQVTGTAATWPVPESDRPGRLDYRIMVATDYSRTDLPAEFRIDEAQAISIIESVQASACLRPSVIESAAAHYAPYILE